jgi:uncharacterized damage-inducible protein DinB
MIDPEYCGLFARYNAWMNERLYTVAALFSDEERKRDRGAFFGSIHCTLNHLLWGDSVWLARFTGTPYPHPAYGADLYDDFPTLARERSITDTAILDWAEHVTSAWLASSVEYTRRADMKTVRIPAWIAATHMFNHATHHRGQLTTLIKQAGKDPGVTDLPFMPGVAEHL